MKPNINMFYDSHEVQFKKNDIVICTKKTRSRHYSQPAIPDQKYLVTSVFVNNYGTCKLFLIDEKGEQFYTTDNCVELITTSQELKYRNDDSLSDAKKRIIHTFLKGKKLWMDKTYVPVFASHLYDHAGHPVLVSRDHSAVLFKKMVGDEKVWINKDMVHEDDVKLFLSSSLPPAPDNQGKVSETITFRVPSWFAEKKGLIGN